MFCGSLKNGVLKYQIPAVVVFRQSHTVASEDLVTPIGKNHMHAKAFCTGTVVYLFGPFLSSSYARRHMQLPYIKYDTLSPKTSVPCSH